MLQPNQMLIPADFAPAETKRNVWEARIAVSTKYTDIFKPEFFCNIAERLLVGDRIECRAEDGTYFAELYVTAVAEKTPTKNANWANVIELRKVDLVREEDKKLKLPEGFYAKFRGNQKWCVMRNGTTPAEDQVIVDRQLSRADAIHEFEKMRSKMVA